jgi:hypothetical protein
LSILSPPSRLRTSSAPMQHPEESAQDPSALTDHRRRMHPLQPQITGRCRDRIAAHLAPPGVKLPMHLAQTHPSQNAEAPPTSGRDGRVRCVFVPAVHEATQCPHHHRRSSVCVCVCAAAAPLRSMFHREVEIGNAGETMGGWPQDGNLPLVPEPLTAAGAASETIHRSSIHSHGHCAAILIAPPRLLRRPQSPPSRSALQCRRDRR